MSLLRLAIIGARGIPARYGGFETFAEELSVRLSAKGINVTVFCEDRPSHATSFYRGVNLEYLPKLALGPLAPIALDALALWKARKSYDLIYVLGYAAPLFFWIPRTYRRQVWVNMDGLEWARSKWGWFAKTYLRAMEFVAVHAADRTIADALAVREFLQSRHSRMAPCDVISYGAPLVVEPPDSTILAKWGLEPYSYYLSVARLEPENHVVEIIKGFLDSSSLCPLVLVGSLQSKSKYVKKLLSYRSPKVMLLGGVYDSLELRSLRFYSRAHLHGHSVGGTNPSLLEALGCGNVVIAHENVFNREVCGDYGLYFSTPDQLSVLIKDVDAFDPSRRRDCSVRARSIVSERYSWDRVADKYYELICSTTKYRP